MKKLLLLLLFLPTLVYASTLDCIHDPRPYTTADSVFTCSLSNATNKTFGCFGITQDPESLGIIFLYPIYKQIDFNGTSGAYFAIPEGGEEQKVKVIFGHDRLKADTLTQYSVKCVSNETSAEILDYSVNLTPVVGDLYPIPESALSVKRNKGYSILAFSFIFFVILVLLFVWRVTR